MPKKLHLKNLYDVVLEYICTKNIYNVLKNENIFKQWLKQFLKCMKIIISTKYCDYILLK
jgi:aryl-alcohol dehydrogenase-like predicted oxidoreductase